MTDEKHSEEEEKLDLSSPIVQRALRIRERLKLALEKAQIPHSDRPQILEPNKYYFSDDGKGQS